MSDKQYTEAQWHVNQGESIFSEVWELLGKNEPTDEEIFRAIHGAHAATYHWTKVGNFEQMVKGEWLVSRVYAQLGMGDQALVHGQYAFDLCQDNGITNIEFANACEAIARAAKLLEDDDLFEGYYRMAFDAAKVIENPKEKSRFLDELKGLK